jgi:uncharacterized protein
MVDRGKRKVTMKDKAFYAIFICLATGALASVLFLHSGNKIVPPKTPTHDAVLESKGTAVFVTTAKTEAARQQGLSGVPSLPPNAGKLFVFEQPGIYGIWMKDMLFSIDIIWMDKDMKVVDIKPNVAPSTYPEVFYPSSEAMYVLETNAGFAQTYNLSIEDVFTLRQ